MFMLPEGTMISAFIGGAISKVINDGVDYTKPTIRSVLNDKNNRNYSTQIYRIIEKSLNIVTDNAYKNSDDLYDTIEKIFSEFKNHGNTLESVKCGLNVLGTDASDQRCENFLEKFYQGIQRDDDLYKSIMMNLEQKEIKINQEGFQKLNEKLDRNQRELNEKIDNINENLNGSSLVNEENTNYKDLVFENNKKQDYIKIWNSRLFLHLDNDERSITLADAFIMPNVDVYYYHSNFNESEHERFEQILSCFLNGEKTSVLLIAGVPGIGKTSITSWFANKFKEDDRVIILRFRDWDYNDFRNGLLNAICDILCCNRKDLSDKILVLDGFDEIKCLDSRNRILNEFINDINDLERSKIIITSRPSYIDQRHFNNNIVLRPFNIEKIKEFYENITGKVLNERDIDTDNLDVLGVPVILYMAIMSDIDITKNTTKPKLYNRIFAERGGIFDKFCEYDSGSQIMRNPDNIVCYLEFLRTVAFKMFEKNELVISRSECEIPELSFQGKTVSILEFPIKHLFENISENIEFIHTSIYEYFVSEYVFAYMKNIMAANDTEKSLAKFFGEVLLGNILSDEILEFLKFRIKSSDLNEKDQVVNEAFKLMLQDGMSFYSGKCYRNVIDCELTVFKNMLEIVHVWDEIHDLKFGDLIWDYLRYNKYSGLNLSGMAFKPGRDKLKGMINLSKSADLSRVYLRGANLKEADLNGINFIRADLKAASILNANCSGTDLSMADLSEADLRGTNLEGADLEGADLEGAIFDEEQVEYLRVKINLRGAKVYLENKDKIICYEDYCKITPNQVSVFDYFKDKVGDTNEEFRDDM